MSCERYLDRLRQARPLIHHVTNQVTMNDCANVAYAIGARPTMAFDAAEVRLASGQADAVVWNLGTFHPGIAAALRGALPVVCGRPIPVIIDPVAAQAYPGRRDLVLELLERFSEQYQAGQLRCRVILRGNASELASLITANVASGGVDHVNPDADPTWIVNTLRTRLAGSLPIWIALTGPADLVSCPGQNLLLTVAADCPQLGQITGAGCMSNTLIAGFTSVNESVDEIGQAIHHALHFMIQSGQRAAGSCSGLSTFRTGLIDEISGPLFRQSMQ
jgi:hydroxyethylthiazole kinase